MGAFHVEDPRNALFVHFIRLLGKTAPYRGEELDRSCLRPQPRPRGGEGGGSSSSRGDCHVLADVVNIADSWVPQLRNRFILLAAVDQPLTFPQLTHAPIKKGRGRPKEISLR